MTFHGQGTAMREAGNATIQDLLTTFFHSNTGVRKRICSPASAGAESVGSGVGAGGSEHAACCIRSRAGGGRGSPLQVRVGGLTPLLTPHTAGGCHLNPSSCWPFICSTTSLVRLWLVQSIPEIDETDFNCPQMGRQHCCGRRGHILGYNYMLSPK